MVENEKIIRHAYENVLTASARLAAFATCQPIDSSDSLINDRQAILAVDDILIFAINARRLMESTATLADFAEVKLTVGIFDEVTKTPTEKELAITRIMNIAVHHKHLDIVRFKRDMISLRSDADFLDFYKRHLAAGRSSYPPLVSLQSDKSGLIVIKLSTLVEFFENRVLVPIIEACDDKGLYLAEKF